MKTVEQENLLGRKELMLNNETDESVHLVLSEEAKNEVAQLERQYRETVEKMNK